MTLGFIFWLLMLLAVIFNGWSFWQYERNGRVFGISLFVFVLLFILGWRVFGFVIQG